MATLIRRRYGRLGLQLTLAFVVVAVGAVTAANVVAALYVYSDARHMVILQETSQAKALALGAAVTFTGGGWAGALEPVIAVAGRSGGAVLAGICQLPAGAGSNGAHPGWRQARRIGHGEVR